MDNLKTNKTSIHLDVSILVAPPYLAADTAMLELRKGIGNKNDSKYTEEEYKKEIIKGNVIIAMLKDDPIAYAIKKNDSVIEYYISWEFEDTELKESLLSFAA